MTQHQSKYYTDKHHKQIANAKSYGELYSVAMEVLTVMPRPIVVVCGPISTGGAGNIKDNLEIFSKTIKKLADDGIEIFDQMPFEGRMQILKDKQDCQEKEKNQTLLDEFYLPIYNSGLIEKMYFIHGWESSHGSRWERSIAQKNNIGIEDLPKDFLSKP